MNIFQICASFFALFMLYVVTIHKRKAKLSLMEVSFWYGMWFFFIIISLFPELLNGIAQGLYFARVFDLLIVVALMIITVIVVLNYFTQKQNQKILEDFVRRLAINEKKRK